MLLKTSFVLDFIQPHNVSIRSKTLPLSSVLTYVLFKSYTNHQILWVSRKTQIKKPINHIIPVTTDPKIQKGKHIS